jgi:hypothetical protein
MSSLFDNRQETNLKACEQMVDAVLVARGLDANRHRIVSQGGPAWGMTAGSAEIFIFLTSGTSGDNFIQVIAPVMTPPQEELAKPKLLRKLLELNATELTGAAFALRGDEVVITTDRSTVGLDPIEVEEMIRRVSDYADHYDDALTEEFGGIRHADT